MKTATRFSAWRSTCVPFSVQGRHRRVLSLTVKHVRFVALAVVLAGSLVGCGDDNSPAGDGSVALPACDTQRAVFFVQRCGLSDTAQCKLYTTAPAGSVAEGCTVPLVDATSGAVTLLECAESCQ